MKNMTHYKKTDCVDADISKVDLNAGERITAFSVKTKKAEYIIGAGVCQKSLTKFSGKDVANYNYKPVVGNCRNNDKNGKVLDKDYKLTAKGRTQEDCEHDCTTLNTCQAYYYKIATRTCQLWIAAVIKTEGKVGICYQKQSNYVKNTGNCRVGDAKSKTLDTDYKVYAKYDTKELCRSACDIQADCSAY